MVLNSKSKSYFMTNCIRYQFLFFPPHVKENHNFRSNKKVFYIVLDFIVGNYICTYKIFNAKLFFSFKTFEKVFSMKLGPFVKGKVYWLDSNGQLALIAYPTYNKRSYNRAATKNLRQARPLQRDYNNTFACGTVLLLPLL